MEFIESLVLSNYELIKISFYVFVGLFFLFLALLIKFYGNKRLSRIFSVLMSISLLLVMMTTLSMWYKGYYEELTAWTNDVTYLEDNEQSIIIIKEGFVAYYDKELDYMQPYELSEKDNDSLINYKVDDVTCTLFYNDVDNTLELHTTKTVDPKVYRKK